MLNGFKSFYSRTEINLKQGIIGIVGPNGCGKSNIYDAVQWVLGEQSAKQLRGDEISDVIARGNVRRAEKKQAEAYLTFEDCTDVLDTDRDQIEVGRKVNTDGEGTYYLNGEEVRLKDVQDLFRDTGIGQDLYSSIGQGEVLKLIDSKPEERREIIEEAAGIASYRHRRDLTQRRLKQTRDELEQVDKNLRQKKGRLSQLRGQAEKAQEVREYQSELREKRLILAHRDYKRVNETIENHRENLTQKKEKLETIKEEKDDITSRKKQLKTIRRSIKSKLDRLRSLLEPAQERKEQLREKLSELKTRSRSLRDQKNRETSNTLQLERQHQSELAGLARSNEEYWRSSLNHDIGRHELEYLNDIRENLKQSRKKLKDKREKLRDQVVFKQKENIEIERKLDSSESKLLKVREKKNSLDSSLRDLWQVKDELNRSCRSHRRSLYRNETERIKLKLRKTIRNRELSILEELQNSLKNKKNRLQSRLDRLVDREEKLEAEMTTRNGISPAAKSLLEKGDSNGSGVIGVLAEHLDVEDQFRKPLEAVLGDRLDDVLVASSDALPRLLRLLNGKEDGPVRLTPLHTGNTNGTPPQFPDQINRDKAGYLGKATEFVRASQPAQDVMSKMLKDVVVVDDLGELLSLESFEAKFDKSFTYVDLEGSVLFDDGTLAYREAERRSNGVLRQKEELESVRADINDVEVSLKQTEKKLNSVRSLIEASGNLNEQIQGSLNGVESEVKKHRSSLREKSHELRRKKETFHQRRNQLIQVQARFIRQKHQDNAVNATSHFLEQLDTNDGGRDGKLRNQLQKLESELEEVREKRRSAEQDRSVSESRLRESESRMTEQQERLNYLSKNIRENDRHVDSLERKRLKSLKKLHKNELLLDWNAQERRTLNQLLDETSSQENSIASDLETIGDQLREKDRKVEKFRGEIKKIESELTNEEARRSELVENIEDDLEVRPAKTILDEENYEENDTESDVLRDRVRTLKNKIRNLQPVNMLASEEAEDLEEEVKEVQEQFDDLQNSCEKLESLIDRLNNKARKQFLEAFSEIQNYFEEFVSELFQGGRGSIELTDDPVLESGVKIEIEPPGEKLRTMSALSGGEKTLGALAFLFALYERKSTPFCFLDEVDHPLDDENVNQFINLLSRYRERTQFIIITHNKLTMQATDKLFGVTMEESGVTSIVPMELEDAESLREPQEVA